MGKRREAVQSKICEAYSKLSSDDMRIIMGSVVIFCPLAIPEYNTAGDVSIYTFMGLGMMTVYDGIRGKFEPILGRQEQERAEAKLIGSTTLKDVGIEVVTARAVQALSEPCEENKDLAA